MKKIVILSLFMHLFTMNATEIIQTAEVQNPAAENSKDYELVLSLINRGYDIPTINPFGRRDKLVHEVAYLMLQGKISVSKPYNSEKSLAERADDIREVCPNIHEFIMYGKKLQSWKQENPLKSIAEIAEYHILAAYALK